MKKQEVKGMYNSKKLMGMPVVSLADGQQLGQVKGFIIHPAKMSIVALLMERQGWFKEQPVIPYQHVKNVGQHVVTVDQPQAMAKLSSFPELEALAKNPLPLLKNRVITEEGALLGTVDDFYFDPQSGRLLSLEIRKGIFWGKTSLPTEKILTWGKDALIVQAHAEIPPEESPSLWVQFRSYWPFGKKAKEKG